jgi:hypothetical protein
MEMKVSDVLDRFTILRMKKRFDKRVDPEYKEVEQEVFRNILQMPAGAKTVDIVLTMLDLMEANSKVWENESAIRKEYPDDPSNTAMPDTALSEIGRRTIIIRGHNKLRLQAKAEVDKMFGQRSDVKVDHASE